MELCVFWSLFNLFILFNFLKNLYSVVGISFCFFTIFSETLLGLSVCGGLGYKWPRMRFPSDSNPFASTNNLDLAQTTYRL